MGERFRNARGDDRKARVLRLRDAGEARHDAHTVPNRPTRRGGRNDRRSGKPPSSRERSSRAARLICSAMRSRRSLADSPSTLSAAAPLPTASIGASTPTSPPERADCAERLIFTIRGAHDDEHPGVDRGGEQQQDDRLAHEASRIEHRQRIDG